ncbi:MAG: hypothetical protein HYX69_09090 [Planctomycetia bacterium]|nr:hypothetical protein [Planctomycetia bacterium]
MSKQLALPLLCCLFAAGLAARAHGQDLNPPTIAALRVGFDEHYKIAHWAPIEITFQGGTTPLVGQVELILPDGDGTPSRVIAPRPVQLLPGQQTKVLMCAKFGRIDGGLRIVFRVEGKAVIDREFDNQPGPDRLMVPWAMQVEQPLIVTLGSSIGVEEAIRLHQYPNQQPIEVVHLGDVSQLPTEWYGYDGVDALIISTSQPEMFAKLLDTGARVAALAEWIEQGGKLVLVAGASAPTVLAPDAPLARFAPGRFVEVTTLRKTTGLEGYIGGARKVRPTGRELTLSVPRLEKVDGKVEIAEGDLPMVVRSPRRFGEIVFVAVDLDQQPFVDWDGRGPLVNRLLGFPEPTSTNANNQPGVMVTPRAFARGSADLANQLRLGLDNFRNVTTISFAVVALLILGYIVLIGPGDYFLVKRLLKRMELTWITFPLWVVLVSAGAYALALYTKGDDLRLNQVDLVDVDVQSGVARGTTWLNLFTPQTKPFDLELVPRDVSGADVADGSRLFAWLGSDMNQYSRGASGFFSGQYVFAPSLDRLIGVPIQVWSTKSFIGRSSYPSRDLVKADLTMGPEQVPEGTITNTLPIDLAECMVVSGRWAYLLGDLKSGQVVQLKPGEQRDLPNVLHDASLRAAQVRPNNAYNEALAGSVMDTLQQMMFYKAAGRNEAGLSNSYQQFVDLSHLLTLDRAILVGRAQKQAAQLVDGGAALAGPEDQHWTVYRFIFAVKRPSAARK